MSRFSAQFISANGNVVDSALFKCTDFESACKMAREYVNIRFGKRNIVKKFRVFANGISVELIA